MKTFTIKQLTLVLPFTLLAACGVSTSEVDERAGADDRIDEQAELSSTSAGKRCARGQAYCPSTRRCYPEACLSCCFFPACGRGEAYCPSTNSCYPEACLSCCRVGAGNGGDPNTDPAVCDPARCGPAPAMPTIRCADGSLGGFTGRCLPRQDNTCGWEVRRCPTAADDAR